MENLFDRKTYDQSKNRLGKINSETSPIGGKMTAAQMLHHCQKPLEVALQKKDYGLRPNLLAQWFFKRMMYNDKPWPKGMATPNAFKVEGRKKLRRRK